MEYRLQAEGFDDNICRLKAVLQTSYLIDPLALFLHSNHLPRASSSCHIKNARGIEGYTCGLSDGDAGPVGFFDGLWGTFSMCLALFHAANVPWSSLNLLRTMESSFRAAVMPRSIAAAIAALAAMCAAAL